MIYLIAALTLSLWAAYIGATQVLNKRLSGLSIAASGALAMYIGTMSCIIDGHFGFECHYQGVSHGGGGFLSFYKWLFMKNWALSIFVIAAALFSYEISKALARRYKAGQPEKHIPLSQRIQDLP